MSFLSGCVAGSTAAVAVNPVDGERRWEVCVCVLTGAAPSPECVCFSDKDQTAVADPRQHGRHVQRRDRLHQVTSLCLCCVRRQGKARFI